MKYLHICLRDVHIKMRLYILILLRTNPFILSATMFILFSKSFPNLSTYYQPLLHHFVLKRNEFYINFLTYPFIPGSRIQSQLIRRKNRKRETIKKICLVADVIVHFVFVKFFGLREKQNIFFEKIMAASVQKHTSIP